MLLFSNCCIKKSKSTETVKNKLNQKDDNGELIFEDIQNLREFIKRQSQN